MIQESVRELSSAERAELQIELGPPPPAVSLPRAVVQTEGCSLMAVACLTLAVIAVAGGNRAGLAIAGLVVVLVGGYRITAEVSRNVRAAAELRARAEAHRTQRRQVRTRILQDGRVIVKRVQAVAVVELEPLEDEGPGYLFDLGNGQVLFLKGEDYVPSDEAEHPWPNTDFDIVRSASDGEFINLYCHGDALVPTRVVRGEECDPAAVWDAREEVLKMSLDEALTRVLRRS